MTIKRILLPLSDSWELTGQIETGLAVTNALDAHVEALLIRSNDKTPQTSPRNLTDSNRHASEFPLEFITRKSREVEALHAYFVKACSTAGIALSCGVPPSQLSASWREAVGAYVEVAVRRASAFDLVIAGSASHSQEAKKIVQNELLQTGRPVLLAPSQLKTNFTNPAMIAWSDRPECWRAISIAVPLLRIARTVKILRIGRTGTGEQNTEDDLLCYLGLHGITATVELVEPSVDAVGDLLLAAAAEDDCGLVVMGAYSHRRLHERLKKGTTEHVLSNSSTRPVLMAH
ncbi:MAG: universal stress protein [Proteobacteria bacterium]|nr:universal stress protein [Pseudomonadota bacterium]